MKRLKRRVISMLLSLIMAVSMISVYAPEQAKAASNDPAAYGTSDLFGPNVYIFDPNDSNADIQAAIDQIYAKQETNQFGSDRFAVLFKPGTYDNVRMKVGFYTQVAGLGTMPTDTAINEFDCNADWMGANATCNFWRSAENLTVKQTATWAAAQATSLRRMKFDQWLALDQWGQGWASGGFVADTVVEGTAVAWSEQQYISRNSQYGAWAGGVWNAVFVGMKEGLTVDGSGAPVESNWDQQPGYQYFTSVDQSPVIREKPFLTIDDNGNYSVFVPGLRKDASGVSWENGSGEGTSIGIDQFYIAKPDRDNADSINAALAAGKNLIFTPGIYRLDKAIQVNNANTVVMGMGYATLTPTGMNACMEVADVDGVTVSGLLFDAGPEYTDTLMQVGGTGASKRHVDNPTLLCDLFFRVGGATTGVSQSKTCIIINSKDVIGDNFWVWRADHGDGVAWDKNKTQNGVIINGDNMTMYGLFVEHFHEYQTIWNGNNGRLYFYQSEIPYDVPNQQSWMSHNGTVNGYSTYKVGDNVTSHEAYGLGMYSYHRDATVDLYNAMEVPSVDGVAVYNACTVMLAGNPGISHIVNGTGDAVTTAGERQQIVTYGHSDGIVIPPADTEEDIEGPSVATGKYADWKNNAVIYPEAGQLVAAGPIYLKWKNMKGEATARKYEIYVDGELKGTVNATGDEWMEYEIYSTSVAKHRVKIVAELTNGDKVNSNIRTFFISKKGMGSGMVNRVQESGLSWYYQWSPEPVNGADPKMQFVPMIWGDYGRDWLNNPDNRIFKTVLGFSEPDWDEQSDVSVDQAIAAWPDFMNSGLRVGSPATAIAAPWSDWFDDFMNRVNADNNLDVDFVAIHCYLDGTYADTFIQMIDDAYAKYHKPIWITEFGIAEWTEGLFNGNDESARAKVNAFMKKVIPELDKRDFVERYAWFPFDPTDQYGGASGLYNVDTGVLNSLGMTYRNLGNPSGYVLPNLDGSRPEGSIPKDVVVEDEPGSGTGTEAVLLSTGKTTKASTQLGGNVSGNVVDGNEGTRWESEFSDNQWIYVDLGEVHEVSGVRLVWETAAGKDYTIEVSDDAAGWSTVYQKADGTGGTEDISFNPVNARYVRMNGNTRTTGYGFSLWEFEIYGNAGTDTPGTDPAPTPVPGAVALKVEAENYSAMNGVAAENCNDVDGGQNVGWIDNNDWMEYQVNVAEAGSYKMDLRAKGWNAAASVDIMVNNQNKASVNVNTNNAWETITSGEFTLNKGSVTIRLNVVNGGFNLNWFELKPVSGPSEGDTDNTENYALNKAVSVSSSEGAMSGGNAVDGNKDTRWASQWTDMEWISVDLGSVKQVSKVILNWEAAYGKEYEIQLSADGANWVTAAAVANSDGGTDEITFAKTDARYVRMQGVQRATGYGYSLWEIEVY